MSVTARLPEVRRQLADAAASDAFRSVRKRLAELGITDELLRGALARVTHAPNGQDEMLRLRALVPAADAGGMPASFERYVLLRVALGAAPLVPALALPDEIKQLLLDEFLWIARPREREIRWFAAGHYVFSALCKLVTFRRFPAGQLHWEVTGLQRSVLLRVAWRDLPKLVHGIAALGGFRPAFVPHLAWRRQQIVLSEREHNRSLVRIAKALRLQPAVLGFVAEAWFYAPDIGRVSPHLAWAARLFAEGGGTVVTTGAADESSGVFENSRTRSALAAAGRFRPTLGLAIWPRARLLEWADKHERV